MPIAARSTAGISDIDGPAVAMTRRLSVPLLWTLLFLAIAIAILAAGALFVRSIVDRSFRDAELIRAARLHAADMLREQLDEETGVRGYAAARSPVLLAAYYGGRAGLPPVFARVRIDLERLGVSRALPLLDDAVTTNGRWLKEVAFPIILSHGRRTRLELRGKELVDRFRRDVRAIDDQLARRELTIDAQAQQAIFEIGGFAVAAVVAVVIAAASFTVQQYRLSARLESERAARETEKRIADVLQTAFSERLFPQLPSARFSAAYVPATEQAKIGGDWYDALQLTGDRVLLAIGDVTGHGIDAVVAMNRARQLLISAALLDPTPGHVLERVNSDLMRTKSPLVTAACAVLDTHERELQYALAGHPPPLLAEPGRRPRLIDFGSLPLGVMATTTYPTNRMTVAPGATIVMYTDGLIEYSHDTAAGEALLIEAVAETLRSSAADTALRIRERIFGERPVADDVAILTVTLKENPGAESAG